MNPSRVENTIYPEGWRPQHPGAMYRYGNAALPLPLTVVVAPEPHTARKPHECDA